MSIGFAIAGLAAIAAAVHPRGARSLMGFMGTPEEHLAKFREYLAAAQRPGFSDRQRMALIERAKAESYWTEPSADEMDALIAAEAMFYAGTREPPSVTAPMAAKSNLVVRKREKLVDPRHPPEGWKIAHSYKGNTWLIVSLGGGNYEARRGGQTLFTGTGNRVLTQIHGHSMDVYNTLNLGKPGRSVFDPMNPPSGWYR